MPNTRRQAVTEALRNGPKTALDLASQFGVPVKTVITDLGHIRRSSRRKYKFIIRQAECFSCGFKFRDRYKVNAPSRCPRCGGERIRDPDFSISE